MYTSFRIATRAHHNKTENQLFFKPLLTKLLTTPDLNVNVQCFHKQDLPTMQT